MPGKPDENDKTRLGAIKQEIKILKEIIQELRKILEEAREKKDKEP